MSSNLVKSAEEIESYLKIKIEEANKEVENFPECTDNWNRYFTGKKHAFKEIYEALFHRNNVVE